ncbi:MAG: S8 family serine peptidase, partial [Clostridiales Family XIII bacterium]|nr:S8 family serine peptidase [Clostridiales Family XIII bacterium]
MKKPFTILLPVMIACSVFLAPLAASAQGIPAGHAVQASAESLAGSAAEAGGPVSDPPAAVAEEDITGGGAENAESADIAGLDAAETGIEPLSEAEAPPEEPACEPAEILVVMKEHVDEEAAARPADDVVSVEPLGTGEKLVVIDVDAENVETAIAAYENDPAVEYAQPNYQYSLMGAAPPQSGPSDIALLSVPSDPYFAGQWSLQAGFATGINEAWDELASAGTVEVAVLDSGMQIDHPDLQANINAAKAYNAVTGTADVTDELIESPPGVYIEGSGHGTHIGGILSAATNNGSGIAGAANNHVKIVPVKIFYAGTASGTPALLSNTALIVAGINKAISSGCKIINISAGGSANDPVLHAACDSAKQQGVLIVAAAGNSGKSDPCYPSDYSSVVSVVATDRYHNRAGYSDYNPYKNIAAPGGGDTLDTSNMILSAFPGGRYVYMSGTSMAAPYVSAVAALVWLARPGLSRDQVEQILYNTATDLGAPGYDPYYGYGLVDAWTAVNSLLKANTWSDTGGKTYYYGADGKPVTGWQYIDGQSRYFDPAQRGAVPQGWFDHANGNRYYFWWGGKGVFATGLSDIGGRSYYFNEQGHLQTGWQTVGGQLRYFDPAPANGGAAPQGWFAHSNGKVYYFWWGGKGAFATGELEIVGKAYVFKDHGQNVAGLMTEDGRLRELDP